MVPRAHGLGDGRSGAEEQGGFLGGIDSLHSEFDGILPVAREEFEMLQLCLGEGEMSGDVTGIRLERLAERVQSAHGHAVARRPFRLVAFELAEMDEAPAEEHGDLDILGTRGVDRGDEPEGFVVELVEILRRGGLAGKELTQFEVSLGELHRLHRRESIHVAEQFERLHRRDMRVDRLVGSSGEPERLRGLELEFADQLGEMGDICAGTSLPLAQSVGEFGGFRVGGDGLLVAAVGVIGAAELEGGAGEPGDT